jgi:hypothetical protein
MGSDGICIALRAVADAHHAHRPGDALMYVLLPCALR